MQPDAIEGSYREGGGGMSMFFHQRRKWIEQGMAGGWEINKKTQLLMFSLVHLEQCWFGFWVLLNPHKICVMLI